MTDDFHNLIAFLALVGAIVALALWGERTDLAIMTGLVGVLGTFRPRQPSNKQDETLKAAVDKIPPDTTTQTGDRP